MSEKWPLEIEEDRHNEANQQKIIKLEEQFSDLLTKLEESNQKPSIQITQRVEQDARDVRVKRDNVELSSSAILTNQMIATAIFAIIGFAILRFSCS